MLASDFIRELQKLINEHGDLEVLDGNNENVDVEYNADDEPAFIVY